MSSVIELAPEDLPILLEAYDNKRKQLREKMREITIEIKKLDERIARIKNPQAHGTAVVNTIVYPGLVDLNYNVNAVWNDKIKFILKEHGGALTSSQIVTRVLQLEPNKERLQVMRSVSATLANGGKFYTKVEKPTGNEYTLK